MRGLISAAVITAAILLQIAVADRITFPGGTGPDLVLLTVAALALANGPMAGIVTGFCAGLALDVAPPAGHLVGQDALVFCLVGYACGLLATGPVVDGVPEQEYSALFEIGVTAAGAACGEALAAGLGVMLSDPRVSWPAIKHVLPLAIGYDLLLSPFVLFAVAAMLRLAGRGAPASPAAASSAALRRAAWAAVPSSGAVRQVAGTNAPRLRLSSKGKSESWLGGARGSPGRTGMTATGTTRPGMARHEPHLKPSSLTPWAIRGTPPAGPSGFPSTGGRGGQAGAARLKFGGRRGEGTLGGSLLGGAGRSPLSRSRLSGSRLSGSRLSGSRLSGSWLSGPSRFSSSVPVSRLASTRLGASLLGGSVFSSSSPLFAPRSASLSGRSRLLSGRGVTRTQLGSGPRQPRFRKAGAVNRLVHGLRRATRRKSPGKGWLRGASPGRSTARRSLTGHSPGRGWLRRSRGRSAGTIGPRTGSARSRPVRLRMRPRTLKKSWRRSGGFK